MTSPLVHNLLVIITLVIGLLAPLRAPVARGAASALDGSHTAAARTASNASVSRLTLSNMAQSELTIATLARQIWTGAAEGATFGSQLAAGDVDSDGRIDLLVSANQNNEYGEILIYAGISGGFSTEPDWTYVGATPYDLTGSVRPVVADFNDDGFADLAISASGASSLSEDEPSDDAGRIDLYLGSESGPSSTPVWSAIGDAPDAFLGTALAAGDINGDGISDLIGGQVGDDEKLSIWFGDTSGLSSAPDQVVAGVGNAAASGDYNGDGVDDLFAIGSSTDLYGLQVFLGINGDGLSSQPAVIVPSDPVEIYFDYTVRNAGDINGDGFEEVIATDAFYPDLDAHGTAVLLVGAEDLPTQSVVTPSEDLDWLVTGSDFDEYLGWDAAGAGDVNGDGYADVLVSMPGFNAYTGQIQLYLGGPDALDTTPSAIIHGEEGDSFFGEALAAVGDVNADGYDDFVVSAGDYPDGLQLGRVYLVYGGASFEAAPPNVIPSTRPAPGPPSKPVLQPEPEAQAAKQWSPAEEIMITNGAPDPSFGWPAIIPGDVNGDGIADLLVNSVGSPDDDIPSRLLLYFGDANGFDDSEDWEIRTDTLSTAPLDDPEFVSSFASLFLGRAGDANGDGYDDFAVAIFDFENELSHAFVFLGSADGPLEPPIQLSAPDIEELVFGVRLASPGDINGDGYDELVVATLNNSENSIVFSLYMGSAAGTEPESSWALDDIEAVEDIGFGLSATRGDVNDDGYDDLLLGAPGYPNGEEYGQVYLFYGGPDGLANVPDWNEIGPEAGAFTGIGVAHMGDVNGDGRDDFVVSQPSVGDEEGQITLYFGHPDGPDALPPQQIPTLLEDSAFGILTFAAGDVDGDGQGDLVAVSFVEADEDMLLWQLFLSDGQGLLPQPVYEWSSPLTDEELALFETIGAGDLDGDGFSDIVSSQFDFSSFVEGEPFAPARLTLYRGQAATATPVAIGTTQWRPSRRQIIEHGPSDEAFGWPASMIGDVNGDGFDDLAVNSLGNPETELSGRIVVYYGSQDGVGDEPNWQVNSDNWITNDDSEGATDTIFMGFGVGYAGDINGDGYHDLAANIIDFESEAAELHIYYGGADGLDPQSQQIPPPDIVDLIFGLKSASVGDTNGDGYSDLGVFAIQPDNENPTVYVYHGGPDGLDSTPAWTLDSLIGLEGFGIGLSAAGDVDNDGYDDLLVGDPGSLDPLQQGQVWLYRGGENGLTAETAWTVTGESAESFLGLSVTYAGDVDDDGFGDVVINEPGYQETGRILVYYGGDNAPAAWRRQSIPSPFSDKTKFGIMTFAAGDVNGDGYSDLLVASRTADDEQSIQWQIFLGSPDGLFSEPAFEVAAPGGSPQEFILLQTTHAGDLNADGYDDFVLSALNFEALGESDEINGGAVVYYGGDGAAPVGASIHWTPVSNNSVPPSAEAAIVNIQIEQETVLRHDGLRFHSLSPDGQNLLAIAGRQLCIVQVADPAFAPRCAEWDGVLSSVYFEVITWSPDGRYLALTENSPVYFHDSDIWIFDTVELQFTNLTDDGNSEDILVGTESTPPVDLAPVWSPDGTQILFARSQRTGGQWSGTGLYSVAIADGVVTQLVDSVGVQPLLIASPMHFSADGTTLYYSVASNQRDNFDDGIWSLRYDAFSAQHQLSPGMTESLPRLVGSGAQMGLVYYPILAGSFAESKTYALWDMTSDQLTDLTPTRQPEELAFGPSAAALSPDGTKVAFAYLGEGDVYYLEVRDSATGDSKILHEDAERLGVVQSFNFPVLSWAATDHLLVGQGAEALLLQLGSAR